MLKSATLKPCIRVAILPVLIAFLANCGGSDSGPVLMDDQADNCPGIDNVDQLDTDLDGAGDACDFDDDGDGFSDADDPAPLDPTIPGDFSTPEAILNDPTISTAIAEAEALGFSIPTLTTENPPNLTGYYNRPDRGGRFPYNSAGFGQGRSIVGSESRITQSPNNVIESASVIYTDLQPLGFSFGIGTLIRGEGNTYTSYSRSKLLCTESGSNYAVYSIGIGSGTVDPVTGNLTNLKSISSTIDVEGELTTACANRLNGELELVGAWSVAEVPLSSKVQASELVYMCVDTDAAYAPTESWIRSDGLTCTCTEDFQTSCQ